MSLILRDTMRASLKILVSAAFLFGSAAFLQPSDASAQPHPRFRPAYGAPYAARPAIRPWRGGYRPAYYGRRYYGGYRGYRPAYYGYRRYGYPYGYYRRGYYGGGAVAAGLIGGLALGTIASAAANPYYYGYPYGYYRPAYYPSGGNCYLERRRIVNRYGRVVIRRVETCY